MAETNRVTSLKECLQKIIDIGDEILRSVQDSDWNAVARLNSSRHELASMLSSIALGRETPIELQSMVPEVLSQNQRIQDVMAKTRSRMSADMTMVKDGYRACLEYRQID